MSKFNTAIERPTTLTQNYEGGEAYQQSNELELISILLTSFVSDQFYRSENETLERVKYLMSKVDPKFAAKLAIFARDKFGMRSITHVVAGELASYSSGKEWSKNFFDKIIVRVDDMTEIMSYYLNNKTDKNNPKFPNGLKKGFSKAFDRFDNYQLAKYRADNKEVKLIDIVNLVHPFPNEKNKEALESLVNGTLKSTETWESKLSQAGQMATDNDNLQQLKADAWKDLIESKKIGMLALLRNLRNILNQCPDMISNVCDILTNEESVVKSRILPFRFHTAYEEISKIGNDKNVRQLLQAISTSLDISAKNIPNFIGETLVVIDVSSSMKGNPAEISSLFGAMVVKANNCDVMTFATNASYKNYNPMDSILTIKSSFQFTGGGTNFHTIFESANKLYDRILIFSDMQGFIGYKAPLQQLSDYKKKFSCNPFIYSIDLAGYGTLQFPQDKVFALSGLSDKIFKIMELLELDKNALVSEINSIEL